MAATALEMQSVVAVIRGGSSDKNSCRKRREQQMMSRQCNILYIWWAGKNKMKTIYLTKAWETDRPTDGQSLLMRCEDASKKLPMVVCLVKNFYTMKFKVWICWWSLCLLIVGDSKKCRTSCKYDFASAREQIRSSGSKSSASSTSSSSTSSLRVRSRFPSLSLSHSLCLSIFLSLSDSFWWTV